MAHFHSEQIRDLWRRSNLIIWPGHSWMISFAPKERRQALRLVEMCTPVEHFVSLICDHNESAVILPDQVWSRQQKQTEYRESFGPLICLTLDVPLDIEVSGYLQPAVDALAAAGVSIVPQCALIYDHILVHQKDKDAAVNILKQIQQQAGSNPV